MAFARKCDRCGTYYTCRERDEEMTKELNDTNKVYRIEDIVALKEVDLCSYCYFEFKRWVENPEKQFL